MRAGSKLVGYVNLVRQVWLEDVVRVMKIFIHHNDRKNKNKQTKVII